MPARKPNKARVMLRPHIGCAKLQRKPGTYAKAIPSPPPIPTPAHFGKHTRDLGVLFLARVQGGAIISKRPAGGTNGQERRENGLTLQKSQGRRWDLADPFRGPHLSFDLQGTKSLVFNYFPTFFRMHTKISCKTSVSRKTLGSNSVGRQTGWSRAATVLKKGQLATVPPSLVKLLPGHCGHWTLSPRHRPSARPVGFPSLQSVFGTAEREINVRGAECHR